VLADRYGARRMMYISFSVCAAGLFLMSYPNAHYVIGGVRGPIAFTIAPTMAERAIVLAIVGFVMALGMAAVFKHIPAYYPEHVGAVGGVVGMIGGLGGFFLPIAFGAMNDLIGIWSSCFMLLFVIARRPAVDAFRHPADESQPQPNWAAEASDRGLERHTILSGQSRTVAPVRAHPDDSRDAGLDAVTALFGQQHQQMMDSWVKEPAREAQSEFDCLMKTIRAHAIAEMTTDAQTRDSSGPIPSHAEHRQCRLGRSET
jgi:hypothetical protein